MRSSFLFVLGWTERHRICGANAVANANQRTHTGVEEDFEVVFHVKLVGEVVLF